MKLKNLLFAAGVLCAPASILAGTRADALSVHVPFAFVVAGEEFSAGDYQVTEAENGTICLRGEGKGVISLSLPGQSAKPEAPPALRFVKDDERDYLVSVRLATGETRVLPTPPAARERKLTVASSTR